MPAGYLVTESLPIKNAETVKNVLIQSKCDTFGTPQIVVIDNGCEFTRSLLKNAIQKLGIECWYVPPYTPESTLFVERRKKY